MDQRQDIATEETKIILKLSDIAGTMFQDLRLQRLPEVPGIRITCRQDLVQQRRPAGRWVRAKQLQKCIMRKRAAGGDAQAQAGDLGVGKICGDDFTRVEKQQRQDIVACGTNGKEALTRPVMEGPQQNIGIFPCLGVADRFETGALVDGCGHEIFVTQPAEPSTSRRLPVSIQSHAPGTATTQGIPSSRETMAE